MVEASAFPDQFDKEKRGPQSADFAWYPDWSGETCVIVASGPSARDVPLEIAAGRGCRCIAINESWKLAPWADMLYACDHVWYYKRRGQVAGFAGIKVSQDRVCADLMPDWDIKRVYSVRGVEQIMTGQPGYIGWGGNSGFQAVNLAVHFNPAKIILVGFDMTLDHGCHWHGRHAHGLSNPKPPYVNRWRRVTDNAYFAIQREGIAGFNTSMKSKLVAWPKMSLEDALDA